VADLTANQRLDLLTEIKLLLSDAEFSKEDSWHSGEDIEFSDSCGCYSDWTTESCSFSVFIAGTLPVTQEEQYTLRVAIENRVERWANATLSWYGCECCGEETLSVNVHIFQKKGNQ
jgi:hypothetical protein